MAAHMIFTHMNAQSVARHHHEITSSFSGVDIHALLVSESWLKPTLPSSLFLLPGYTLLRNDRVERRGGGVCIYLREDLPFRVVCQSSPSGHGPLEYLFIEVTFLHSVVVLGVVYAPPTLDYFDELERVLEDMLTVYTNVIIMGDFNTCLLKHDNRATKFTQLISGYNLRVLPLGPTHILKESKSLIDHIIVSQEKMVKLHGQLSAPGFSHHDLIFLHYSLKVPKPKSKTVLMRSLRCVYNEALVSDAEELNWDDISRVPTIDGNVELMNNKIIHLYNKHAPLKHVRIKNRPVQWLTEDIRRLMARRDRAHVKHRHFPSDENWKTYKSLRNACSRACRKARRDHCLQSFSNQSQAQIWRILDSLGVSGNSSVRNTTNLHPDTLNAHFSTPPVMLEAAVRAEHFVKCKPQNQQPYLRSIFFQCQRVMSGALWGPSSPNQLDVMRSPSRLLNVFSI
jgi:hypothetical protein